MTGSIQAQYECVRVLSETDFYDDLKMIDIPVLMMHGEDDQICPFPTTGARSVKRGPAQRRTSGPICQASHAAPKLGRNIRPVTRKAVVGSLGPDGSFEIPIRPIMCSAVEQLPAQLLPDCATDRPFTPAPSFNSLTDLKPTVHRKIQ
jgi:hypothetical protein